MSDMKMNGIHVDNQNLRRKEHKRNTGLDDLLGELSALLEPVEKKCMESFTRPRRPVLFLVGNPRSGTTVFTQFLQSTRQFAVPTNVMSRFYYAPYLGAKIQQLLFNPEFDFRDELGGAQREVAMSSSLGKTKGALAASEMLHFWRRFLPHYDPRYIEPERQGEIDVDSIAAELAAIESVFEQPLALKGAMLLLNLKHLKQCADSSLFVYLRRDPLFIAQSLLLGRENHYGRRDLWWSAMPKEYDRLKLMDVYHQVAGQVYFIKQSIETELADMADEHKLILDYETFCSDPGAVYDQISEKYRGLGYSLNETYQGSLPFKSSNDIRISEEDFSGLKVAYDDFSSGRITF